MLKQFLIKLRNRFGPGNRVRIAKGCVFSNQANFLNTQIDATPGNEIFLDTGVRLRDLSIHLRGSGNSVRIGRDAQISGRIELFGDNNRVEIGVGSKVLGGFFSAHGGRSIIVGAGCLIARGTDFRTSDHHKIFDTEGRRINPDKDVWIADRVWIAEGASVLKGARIESDTVIGKRAVVTGAIPGHSIAAGIPAKVIKSGVTWQE